MSREAISDERLLALTLWATEVIAHVRMDLASDAPDHVGLEHRASWADSVAERFGRLADDCRQVADTTRRALPPGPREPRRPTLSTMLRATVLARDGLSCQECGATEDLTVDHIEPRARGGSDDLTNLQTLCRDCNSRKGARV